MHNYSLDARVIELRLDLPGKYGTATMAVDSSSGQIVIKTVHDHEKRCSRSGLHDYAFSLRVRLPAPDILAARKTQPPSMRIQPGDDLMRGYLPVPQSCSRPATVAPEWC